MTGPEQKSGFSLSRVWTRPSLVLALLTLLIHLLINGRYGFFRDELYSSFAATGRTGAMSTSRP